MKNLIHILQFEWKLLWRSNMLKLLLVVMLGAGVYGIFFGKFEIEKQNIRIAEVKEYEQGRFDSLLTWANLDTSILANKEKYLKAVSPEGVGWRLHFSHCIVNEASPTAGLCLGQRDLFPTYYRINLTDLARQMNTAELANPMKLLTGNFDLSYVFIFLLPLLIISLFFNLYSDEKEKGTLSLLQAQAISLNTILLDKGFLRLLTVWAISAFLLVLGFLIQGVSIANNADIFFQWLLVIFAYTLLWTLFMAGIVALKKGTAVSAMLGLGVWLITTLIMPALLNLFVSANEPLPNRAEIIHAVRAANNRNWDSPKSFVLEKFYEDNPQYSQEDTTHFYKWYYASFALLDKEANTIRNDFNTQINKRNKLIKKWEWMAPAAMVYEHLSKISKTNRESHLHFMEATHDFHDRLKAIYYSKIFAEEKFNQQDLRVIQAMQRY